MRERLSQYSPALENTIKEGMESPISRRRLLRSAVGFAGVGTSVYFLQQEQERADAYDREFSGFSPLLTQEFYGLAEAHYESPLKIDELEEKPEEALRHFSFTLQEPSQVYCYIEGEHANDVFVEPLIVQTDLNRKDIAPVVHTDDYSSQPMVTSLQLGSFKEGEHTVTITRDSVASYPRTHVPNVSLTTPSEHSLLAKFMAHNPVVSLKNSENVLDDIPLAAFCNIKKRDALYKVTSYIIFSSENGGTAPKSLYESFDRTVDVEWVMEQLFTPEGDVLKDRRRMQIRNHDGRQFDGDTVIGNMPVLETATDNNLFGDGRLTIPFTRHSVMNPLDLFRDDGIDEEKIYYSPKPLFLPSGEGSKSILDDHPELQKWSLVELTQEGCVNISDPQLQWLQDDVKSARRYINARFPNRGCEIPLSAEVLQE